MNNKLIARIDDQGRISIPFDLLELVGFENEVNVVLCKCDEFDNSLQLRHIRDIKGYKAIAKIVFDKRRIIFPKPFRDGLEEVELFCFNGAIIIKESS